MKIGALLLLMVLNGFVICDIFVLAPAESLLFRPEVRERISRYIPNLRALLLPRDTQETPRQVAGSPLLEESFVPPHLASLEELTQNWQSIPPRAFPRVVTLAQEAVFTMEAASSNLPEGTRVVALSFDKGLLTLAPAKDSEARCLVPLAATDLVPQLEQSYALWKTQATEAAHKRWVNRKALQQQAAVTRSFADPAGKPLPDSAGAYPILLSSMNAGEVTEVSSKNVLRWHTPVLRDIEGTPTWCVDVDFKATVFCGELDATARALVRNGKVIAWIYPGSREPVP